MKPTPIIEAKCRSSPSPLMARLSTRLLCMASSMWLMPMAMSSRCTLDSRLGELPRSSTTRNRIVWSSGPMRRASRWLIPPSLGCAAMMTGILKPCGLNRSACATRWPMNCGWRCTSYPTLRVNLLPCQASVWSMPMCSSMKNTWAFTL